MGLRGIPNVEGGIETHVENLYPKLATLGCEIEIVVRSPFSEPGRRNVGALNLRRLWSPRSPGLEAFAHSLLAVLYAAVTRPDILHVHAIGPALVTPLARLFGLRVVVTHHGPDYDRDKWGPLARWVLRVGERFGMGWSHARIAISPVIRDLVHAKYQLECDVIPNGVPPTSVLTADQHVRMLGLRPRNYFLSVARMVPEKRQLDLIRAYRSLSPCDWQLVLAGRLTNDSYCAEVRASAAESGVILAGFVAGEALAQLYSHAGAFVLPSSHEGLPIALLEALSYGLPVIASDITANVAVGLNRYCYFALGDTVTLASRLDEIRQRPDDGNARLARRRWVAERYDWPRIAQQTLAVYERILR
jgi:glycosyltransferase involved in cell wall biosynthesis